MAVNNLTLKDQEGDSADWIEIENTGKTTIDLGGWFLTDKQTKLTKWQFPTPTRLAPGSHLLVFASNKDQKVRAGALHTNFRLSSGGEYLALVDPNLGIASEYAPAYPQQFPDVSYGIAGTRPAYFPQSTARAANGPSKPIIGNVRHAPAEPTTTTPITVTADLIRDASVSVSKVELFYRPSYGLERTLAMRDDGQGGDRTAGDDVWTGVIPSGIPPGRQVRWRVHATHSVGNARAPLFRSTPNSPQYFGTRVQNPSTTSTLPILYWWVSNPAAAKGWGTRCSVFYRGKFYENVYVRRRGGSSNGWAKANYKFDFNTGYHFEYDGKVDPVEEFNVNSTWSDKSFVRQVLSYETYDNAGVAGCHAEPVRMQLNGQFHSVAVFIEQTDKRLIEREGLDPRGALYKMFNTLVSSNAGVEKKTRKWEGNSDLSALVSGVALQGAARERFLFDNVDLPAVLSYIAATVLIHDQDHVHKNHYLYRDTEGDGEWRFLPWDKDLTFGRNYFTQYGVLNDIMWADVDPASHPLYGDQSRSNPGGQWNRLINACHSVPRIREMFLRRLRTLMDSILQAPGLTRTQLLFEQRIDVLKLLMDRDVARDKTRWGVPAYGDRSIDFAKGLARVENLYLVPRRKHLFTTHSSSATGIIPSSQPSGLPLILGSVIANPKSGQAEQAYLEIVNCNTLAMDISGWQVQGGVQFTFEPGTVIPSGEAIYLAASPRAFRARSTGPRGGQGLLVVGPYEGVLTTTSPIQIYDGRRQVTSRGGFTYTMKTSGRGDLAIQVSGAPALSQLFHLISTQTNHPLGGGPLLGLGSDALWAASLPLETHPFRVLADASGNYRFLAPPGTLPKGLTLDSMVVAFDGGTNRFLVSPPLRTTF
ncbi:MAG: CotH kinase family protein [Planctomycetota bacterium]|nr:CotH kinase family protein [Planctomycetota bacterium]